MIPHPARQMPFRDLHAGLLQARDAGHVSEQVSSDGLRLYCYSKACVYERAWSPVTLVARGLILDPEREVVVATPFPKFFNVGERDQPIPDLPFEVFDKLDGSLLILFSHAGEWRTATKGSFNSDQARWAKAHLSGFDLSPLDQTITYLAEAIYPANKIVIPYADSGLFLLAAYQQDGIELSYEDLQSVGTAVGWPVVTRLASPSFSDLLGQTATLPATQEGWVLRFSDGLRLKIKGDEYLRIHRIVSHLTPLAIWDLMANGGDLDSYRKDLPEEFWTDFDTITGILYGRLNGLLSGIAALAAENAHLSDKDLGLRLNTLPADLRSFVFPYRKQNGDLISGRSRLNLFKAIRPTRNELEGYAPSSSVASVLEEAA